MTDEPASFAAYGALKAALHARAQRNVPSDTSDWLRRLALRLGDAPGAGRFAPGPRQAPAPTRAVSQPASLPGLSPRTRQGSQKAVLPTKPAEALPLPAFKRVIAEATAQAAAARAARDAGGDAVAVALRRSTPATARSFAPSGAVLAHLPGAGVAGHAPEAAAPSISPPRPLAGSAGFGPARAALNLSPGAIPAPRASVPPAEAEASPRPPSPAMARYYQDMDFEAALDEYFLRLSRTPPASAASFDPKLSPRWVGLNLPG